MFLVVLFCLRLVENKLSQKPFDVGLGDWWSMRLHEDVGVRQDVWLKMNENTWGCWCQKGWVIEDEWEYVRALVSEWMGDWKWMRIHEDVDVRKDGWLKMNENTWGRWCQKGWVIEDEWEYVRALVSEGMGYWRWMRIQEDVGLRKDGWLKMNENTWGRWCQKVLVIKDEWGYTRTLVPERMGDWR